MSRPPSAESTTSADGVGTSAAGSSSPTSQPSGSTTQRSVTSQTQRISSAAAQGPSRGTFPGRTVPVWQAAPQGWGNISVSGNIARGNSRQTNAVHSGSLSNEEWLALLAPRPRSPSESSKASSSPAASDSDEQEGYETCPEGSGDERAPGSATDHASRATAPASLDQGDAPPVLVEGGDANESVARPQSPTSAASPEPTDVGTSGIARLASQPVNQVGAGTPSSTAHASSSSVNMAFTPTTNEATDDGPSVEESPGEVRSRRRMFFDKFSTRSRSERSTGRR